MKLNQFTDIALKALMYLRQATHRVTIDAIAQDLQLQRNHLIKVLNYLVKLGWIRSIRGRHGGLSYNTASDQLKLGEVVRQLEDQNELLNCAECSLCIGCALRRILNESQQAFFANLNRYTLADITSEATQRTLISIIQHHQSDNIKKKPEQ